MASRDRQRVGRSVAILLMLLGCAGRGDDANTHDVGDFGAFAQRLFSELEARPIGRQAPAQIGLFGDLNVLAGENVVMGRYRYRIDSTHAVPTAHMAFFVREDGYDAPVILSFTPGASRWQLDETRFVASGDDTDSLRSSWESNLEGWASKAVDAVYE